MANWRQRPMPEEMLQYAAIDVQVLLPVHTAIGASVFNDWRNIFFQV